MLEIFVRQEKDQAETGVALVEFLIAIPFLLMMALAMFDCGRALNAYLVLSQVVHEGVRQGSTEYALEAGDFELAPGSPACDDATIASAAPLTKQLGLQERTRRLLDLQNLSINSSNICIESGRTTTIATPTTENASDTVYVRIKTNYDGIFPMFRNIPIQVRARGPYLFAADSTGWNL